MQDRQALVQQLREAGMRVTAPRLAVLEVLAEHPHSTADVVARGAVSYTHLTLPTIYSV